MKPASHNRFLRAALLAASFSPLASHAAVEIPSSFGNGADTYLSNDSNAGPGVNHGTKGAVEVRNFAGTRLRVALVRFDVSGLTNDSDNTDATLRFTQTYGANRTRAWTIYGLRDGHIGENWDEATTNYNNAPGVVGPGTGNATFSLDIYNETTNPTGALEQLAVHTYPISLTSGPTTMSGVNLKNFIDADTDGIVTFLLVTTSDNSQTFGLAAKEDATRASTDRPHLILPNGTAGDSDLDGLADTWETANFGDLDEVGTGDPDADTFDNEAEETAGSNPNLAASTPLDIDADGLADLWEDLHFGNNDSISTPQERLLQSGTGDPDNDLNNNLAEFTNSTIPTDRNSFHDTDTDGLNDAWETLHFGDLVTATSTTGDNDTDSYSNADEYTANSNPNLTASIPGDIDGDTLGDAWETQYFGNITTANDPNADPDNDTFTNKQEESSTPIKSNPQQAASIPGDSDGDGLSDLWELNFFSNTTDQNGLRDPDSDLYTNEEEETAGTDPLDNYSFIDTDNDGLNDRWETIHFGNITTASDPGDDPDNDFFTNDEEYLAGADPTNDQSNPDDIDADGLEDAWELLSFPDLYFADGDDDNDQDFATNEEEESAIPTTSPILRASSPDTDFDGLGDAWEIFSFGNLTATDDPGADNDSDGFNNAAEYAAASNGNSAISTPDTDGDGLPDGWEIFHFTDITTHNGSADPDTDGANNQLEFLSNTNPALNTSTPNPAIINTSFGRGSDTSLSNDVQNAGTGPAVISGAAAAMTSRDTRATRLHIPMFRFDVSQLAGDLTNTALRLNVTFASPSNTGTLEVFGLVDGDPGESWTEATTNYLNAPGIIEADRTIINTWSRDPKRVRYLGTITVPAIGQALSNPASLNLKSFIEDDNDGQITLFLRAPATRWYGLSTKEQDVNLAPTLVAPLAEIVAPVDIKITDVSFDTAANQFSMVTTGLATGASYHIQAMKEGETTFTAIPGSTFTGATNPQTVTVTADEQAEPRQFFRIVEGAAP